MNLRTALALPILALSLCGAYGQTLTLAPADETAIRAVLDRQIESWNHHDMKAYVADMTPDVEWVNVVGMWWRGRDEVYQAHEKYHQTIFKTRNLSPWKQVAIRPITPDVAVVTAFGDAEGFTGNGGRVFPPSTSALTFVFVHRDGRWLITEAHNTTVDPLAAAGNPIKH
ncbi:SgcJ/EcaC family oxidoreductase [Granulicella sibirica]|uniref:DUF4440 domain-containing protein n=1 Tax=Granulicella sibirica TaxID=2479048 RepID=A0A4Q0TA90_9BACT|nr:SgcJ/EcaC family oxidoreductase [Granulicella sibirica]RXH58551.1 hypothetical protein GRAN_1861 [Granulicella sibirica]